MRQKITPTTSTTSNGITDVRQPRAECLCKYCQDPQKLVSWDSDVCDRDEIPELDDYPVHSVVSAADRPSLALVAPCSVFDLAGHQSQPAGRAKPQPKTEQPSHAQIIREDGVTRHISLRYQETEQWAEKDRDRRAKQKLPRPPKQSFRIRKEAA